MFGFLNWYHRPDLNRHGFMGRGILPTTIVFTTKIKKYPYSRHITALRSLIPVLRTNFVCGLDYAFIIFVCDYDS
jgi:hypothetical protein